jgi:NADH:ubiquinone oxidoreductase subunit 6 (subunit J)
MKSYETCWEKVREQNINYSMAKLNCSSIFIALVVVLIGLSTLASADLPIHCLHGQVG